MEYKDLVGKAYRNGGRGNDAYDCWGLVIEIYRRQGITLNDYPISFDNSTEENISGIVNTEKKSGKKSKSLLPDVLLLFLHLMDGHLMLEYVSVNTSLSIQQ